VEFASAGGAAAIQLKPQAVHATPPQPEAALTVVIRNTEQAPAAVPVEAILATDATAPAASATVTAQAAEYSANQAESVAAATTATKSENTVSAAGTASSAAVSISSSAQLSYEAVTPASGSGGSADAERRKVTGGDSLVAPDATVARVAGPQTGAYQDLQLKAEPTKTDNSAPRGEAPKAPAAAAEAPAPEKNSTQPLKSVALEFTPDGARDVKVRLSERGGEVHVSVHSTDPSMTRNLRAGVTDLASVLEHAGYDAKAWTSGRQQQGNPQQQQEQTPQRRNSQAGNGAQQFDSFLERPPQQLNQENS
jgi:hypothetical protein